MMAHPATEARLFASGDRPRRTIVRGQGAHLWDADGMRWVDLGASHGVGNLGVGHPEVVAAIARQAAELGYLGTGYDVPIRTEFLRRLTSLLPPGLDRPFLSNSGTEAVEAAIKIARSATRRSRVVAAMRGFHGRTLGALSATWRREFREPFEPLVPDFVHVPFNDPDALTAAVDERTALVLLEPVQGEGGVHVASPEFLRAARERTRACGALLGFDEVQTGIGRTGRMFAFEHHGVVPDLLMLAKSLGGGVPIGATIATREVESGFRGSHHSTFGGNPIACAAADAVLRVAVRDRLAERAERLGERALERLRDLPSDRVREVRGLGLLLGVELRERVGPVLEALEQQGYLALPAGATVLRLLPPLTIEEGDLDSGLEAIEAVLGRG